MIGWKAKFPWVHGFSFDSYFNNHPLRSSDWSYVLTGRGKTVGGNAVGITMQYYKEPNREVISGFIEHCGLVVKEYEAREFLSRVKR